MRERRGIDLAALASIGRAADSYHSRDQDEKNGKTLDHAAKMMRAATRIKPVRLHFLAFIAGSSAISAFLSTKTPLSSPGS